MGEDNNACGKRNEGLQTVIQKAAAAFVYSGQREDSCGLELNIFLLFGPIIFIM